MAHPMPDPISNADCSNYSFLNALPGAILRMTARETGDFGFFCSDPAKFARRKV